MLREIPFGEIDFHPVNAFREDWMALATGNEKDGFNAMTISWGHIGELWNKPSVVCYVRPQRYTKKFMDDGDMFTLNWFGREQREALSILGSRSGRDCDKIALAKLTPFFTDGTVGFEEAKLCLVCRKLYQAPVKAECFVDEALRDEVYSAGDYHDLYIGEIVRVFKGE